MEFQSSLFFQKSSYREVSKNGFMWWNELVPLGSLEFALELKSQVLVLWQNVRKQVLFQGTLGAQALGLHLQY